MSTTRKVILVTGASAGIGKEFVKVLLADGHTVYGAARRVENMMDIQQLGAKVLPLDVTNDESMVQTVQTVLTEQGRIDVLINSAGFGLNAAFEDVSMADARYQFEVNVFGLARLSQLVLPAMRQQQAGKIINISSIAGRMPSPFAAWYHASKHAVEAISDSMRIELQPFGIQVVLIEPGSVKSEWGGIAIDNALKHSGNGPYQDMVRGYVATVRDMDARASEPAVIARLVKKAIDSRRPRIRYVGGFMAKPLLLIHKLLPARLFDALLASQIKPKKP
ncbi:oxidoreductase [Hymenobacter monticola]|uniref:Oxidoreductase n=1 Tax=Hymenobacter monticola TaxID=1705399 RepID=A0ABY4BB79_9BACT|nr:oxidoreductase [Hymenobacter monticola]UOE36410.1 oxidoreductase [Hymenobacter monticola]